MYQCKHFDIQELVPPHIHKEHGNAAWELLDVRALVTLDALSDKFGVLVCNDWHVGGRRKWAGLQTPECPYYSAVSQHTFGRGFSVVSGKVSYEAMREKVLRERKRLFPNISGIELNTNHFGFDCRNHAPVKLFEL